MKDFAVEGHDGKEKAVDKMSGFRDNRDMEKNERQENQSRVIQISENQSQTKSPLLAAGVVLLFSCGIFLLPGQRMGECFGFEGTAAYLLGTLLFRVIGICLLAALWAVLKFPRKVNSNARGWLWCLPFFFVAVFNCPMIALATGAAGVSPDATVIALFVFETLSAVMFEELCFRGMIFPLLLEALRTSPRWQKKPKAAMFLGLVLSSLVFGLAHLLNLVGGGNVGATFLQAAYSFGIGCMCAAAFVFTGNITAPVILHFIYNLGGRLLDTAGYGNPWDAVTVVLTVILAVMATTHGVVVFIKRTENREQRTENRIFCD